MDLLPEVPPSRYVHTGKVSVLCQLGSTKKEIKQCYTRVVTAAAAIRHSRAKVLGHTQKFLVHISVITRLVDTFDRQ